MNKTRILGTINLLAALAIFLFSLVGSSFILGQYVEHGMEWDALEIQNDQLITKRQSIIPMLVVAFIGWTLFLLLLCNARVILSLEENAEKNTAN